MRAPAKRFGRPGFGEWAKKSGDAREEESAAACNRKPREEEGLSDLITMLGSVLRLHRRAARSCVRSLPPVVEIEYRQMLRCNKTPDVKSAMQFLHYSFCNCALGPFQALWEAGGAYKIGKVPCLAHGCPQVLNK
jgi:hypothetical protein